MASETPTSVAALTQYRAPPRDIAQTFADDLLKAFDCRMVTVWSLDPVHGTIILVAVSGTTRRELGTLSLDCGKSLTGLTVDRKRITHFPSLDKPSADGRTFGHPDLVAAFGLRTMVSVPVLNTCNGNQVLAIINLFPGPASSDRCASVVIEKELKVVAAQLAILLEMSLQDTSVRFANRLGAELIKLGVNKRTPDRLCRVVARVVREATDSDAVGVFLESPDENQVRLVASAGELFRHSQADLFTETADRVWRANREFLTPDFRRDAALDPDSTFPPLDQHVAAACVPLRDLAGQSKGVIVALNQCPARPPESIRLFTYEDVAAMTAVEQAFVPYFDILQADRQRHTSLTKLAHELRVPIVAFRAALETISDECKSNGYAFRYNHFEETAIYLDVMRRLLTELELVRVEPRNITLQPKPTSIYALIVQPAKRFVEPLLQLRGFTVDQIRHEGLQFIPKLHIDPALMTQVVFNLLDNAIKYYRGNPRNFRIFVQATDEATSHKLVFRDWGVGVPAGFEERIFDFGVRGPAAHLQNIGGEGIGLWFAREIVRRHGGTLTLGRAANPTEFVLELPRNLCYFPPLSVSSDPDD